MSYVTYTGSSKSWPIEGFAVNGDARGRPKWSEIEVGPILTYKAFEDFTPYLGVSLDWFRGDFRMTETLGELDGTQTRKFAQKGLLRIALGASCDRWRGLVIDGEAGSRPLQGKSRRQRDPEASLRLLTTRGGSHDPFPSTGRPLGPGFRSGVRSARPLRPRSLRFRKGYPPGPAAGPEERRPEDPPHRTGDPPRRERSPVRGGPGARHVPRRLRGPEHRAHP